MAYDSDKVFMDNPIELDRVPREPLSFEFIAQADPGEVWPPIGRTCFTGGLLIVLAEIGTAVLYIGSGFAVPLLPGIATMLGLLLIAWTVGREETAREIDPAWGLGLAILMVVCAVLAGPSSKVISLASGVLMYYATGEFTIHWLLLKTRARNPVITAAGKEDSSADNGWNYQDAMLPAGIASFLFAHAANILVFFVLTSVVLAGVWFLANEKSKERGQSVTGLLRYAIEQTYLYPNAATIPPGLFRCPAGNRSLRAFPAMLFFGCTVAAVIPAVASVAFAPGAHDVFTLGVQVVTHVFIGPGMLLGLWALLASESTYEF